MNILAIDTAGPYLSAAIAKDDKIIARYKSKSEKSHSDMLAPSVGKLLKKTRLKPKDIDLYAISIGPGSFTGLRIGVAFIKGMNLFTEKPVVCVPTLDAMAALIDDNVVCPVVDAKRQNVYTAIYKKVKSKKEKGKSLKRITKYSVIPINEILEEIKCRGTACRAPTVVFTGDGIDVYKEEIIKVLGKKAIFADKKYWHTEADNIAKIGFRMYNKNQGVVRNLSALSPMYLYPRDIQCVRRQQR